MNYPEPDQLREYAADPMPFHHITARDLDVDKTSAEITVEKDTATYRYEPTYINVETAESEWERARDVSWAEIDHLWSMDHADDIEIVEDYICATGIDHRPDQPAMYNAFWILDEITIEVNE